MNAGKVLPLYVALALSLLLASIQGNRVQNLRDGEVFYRWLINAANQTQLGSSLVFDHSPDSPEAMDDVFFAEVQERGEQILPDLSAIDDTLDRKRDGSLHSRLVRSVNHSKDKAVWRFASASHSADLRNTFREYASKNKLQSLGTQFATGDLYGKSQGVYGVGVTSMFFGFRHLAANFIWMQVDKFWHAGQVHRMVPLMRTCVTLDPHFIDAYLVGAWHMAYNITASMDDTPERDKKFRSKYKKRLGEKELWYYLAIDYLKDGVRKNPRDYRIYFDLGFEIYELKLQDHANAVRYLREARRHRHERWVPRMLFRALMNNGEYEEAIEGWHDYLKIFPESDIALEFIVVNEAYLSEALYVEYLECAEAAEAFADAKEEEAASAGAAGNAEGARALLDEASQARAEAAGLREKSQLNKDEAIGVWTDLMEGEGKSTLAQSRILRLGAIEAIHEGNYIEAVAELEVARWNHPTFFEEATELILDIKTEHGLLLDVSEQRAVARREEEAKYLQADEKPPVIRRLECKYFQAG